MDFVPERTFSTDIRVIPFRSGQLIFGTIEMEKASTFNSIFNSIITVFYCSDKILCKSVLKIDVSLQSPDILDGIDGV